MLGMEKLDSVLSLSKMGSTKIYLKEYSIVFRILNFANLV